MPERRRIEAVLVDARPVEPPEGCGVRLVFRGLRGETLEGVADLGPEATVASALGVASVLRLLRAARRAAPRRLRGRPAEAAAHLAAARGVRVRLEVRTRVRLRFTAWTERGIEVVDDVEEVVEDTGVFVVRRLGGRTAVRLPREEVLRRRTSRETWLEITGIEAA